MEQLFYIIRPGVLIASQLSQHGRRCEQAQKSHETELSHSHTVTPIDLYLRR